MSGSRVGRELGRGLMLGWGALLLVCGSSSCATQQATAQALTIVGAAAVVVGASTASDLHCASAAGVGGPAVYCPRSSSGARNAGTALAVAGVGLAAAGYALKPKGPDRVHATPTAAPGSPYRLVRATRAPEATEGSTSGSEDVPPGERCTSAGTGVPGASEGAAQPSGCPELGSEEPAAVPVPPEAAAPPPVAEQPEPVEPQAPPSETGEPVPGRPGLQR